VRERLAQVFDGGNGEAVEALAHVAGLHGEIDLEGGHAETDHGAEPKDSQSFPKSGWYGYRIFENKPIRALWSVSVRQNPNSGAIPVEEFYAVAVAVEEDEYFAR